MAKTRRFCIKLPSRTDLCVWLVAAVVLASLTIKDFITLLKQYTNDNVETNAVIVLENATMSMPDLTLCMVYDDYACSDVLLGTDDDDRRKIEEAVDIVNRYDYSQRSEEANLKIFNAAVHLSKIFDYIDEQPTRIFNPEKSIYHNLSFIDRINMSKLNYLTDKFVQQTCSVSLFHSNVQVSSFSNINKYCQELKAIEKPYITGWCNRTCFPLPTSSVKFEKNNDLAVFSLTRFNARQILGEFKKMELYDNNIGRYGTPLVVSVGRDKLNALKVRFRLHSQVISAGTREACFSYDNYDECMLSCRVNKTMEKCGCVPFSYRTFTKEKNAEELTKSNDVYCRYSSYSQCLAASENTESTNFEATGCSNKCQKLCSFSFYQWSAMEEYTDIIKNDWIDLQLQSESFSYTKFNLDTKMSMEQFLTQLGGLLNFYVGISGLSLFVLMLTMFKWAANKEVLNMFQRKKSTPADLFTVLGPLWFVNELIDRAQKEVNRGKLSLAPIAEHRQSHEHENETKIELDEMHEGKKQGIDEREIKVLREELKREFESLLDSKSQKDNERFNELEKRLMEQILEMKSMLIKKYNRNDDTV